MTESRPPAGVMWSCDRGSLPVVDDNGRIVGMITDRHICMSAVLQDRAPNTIFVAEAMSKALVACGPGDDVETVEELMCRH